MASRDELLVAIFRHEDADMPVSVFTHVRQRYDFWDVFSGSVISSEARMIKPGPAVFEHLLSRYALTADETVFVDDHPLRADGTHPQQGFV